MSDYMLLLYDNPTDFEGISPEALECRCSEPERRFLERRLHRLTGDRHAPSGC